MREMRSTLLSAAAVFTVASIVTPADAQERESRFTIVDGSPGTWVSRGLETYEVSTDDGWTFTGDVGSFGRSNDVSVRLTGTPLPDAPSVDYWDVGFIAPFDEPLEVGVFYEDATRFPFNDVDTAGMDYSSTGRGDNTLLADFVVNEIGYNTDGTLSALSVDFTYYGEQRLNEPVVAEIRFNALVPEPTTLGLAALAAPLMLRRRRKGSIN